LCARNISDDNRFESVNSAMPAAPTFSVIVVCKNPGPRLRAALSSVWEQRGVAMELIVVDGGSTDGSREWLESRRSEIATLISEPDRGIYDAMNKGVSRSRGEWIYFLGADDRLAGDRVLQHTADSLKRTEVGVVSGEAEFEDGRVYSLATPLRPLVRNFVHHQATFYRRRLFSEIGAFDAELAVMGDYDFNLRLWTAGIAFEQIPIRAAICGVAGLSDSGRWRGYREEITVRHRYYSTTRCLFWDLLSAFRFLRKKARRSPARHRPDQPPSPARVL
jgi:putative colanic acid biosynthesis glycosyltransferase